MLREGSKKHVERRALDGAAGMVSTVGSSKAEKSRGKGGAGAHRGVEQGNFFKYSEYPEAKEDSVGKTCPLNQQRYNKKIFNERKASKVVL